MRTASAAVVVAAALLGACVGRAASPPATSLAISFFPNGMNDPVVKHYTLRCGPAAGSIPRPALACRTLAGLDHPFAPTPRGTFCTALAMGPEEAVVKGRLRGAPVFAHLRVQGGCEINRWRRVSDVVPGFPDR